MKHGLKDDFHRAIHDHSWVSGLTHDFYRYPARYSPSFARVAIKMFTEPGDLILDPFMGGGTALVEAQSLGRKSIGSDINELSVFVSKVKTTTLSKNDASDLSAWAATLTSKLNLRQPSSLQTTWEKNGYLRNINGKQTWPIRKILALAISELNSLKTKRQRNFARCVLLKTGQWALDSRIAIPSAEEFRKKLSFYFKKMVSGTVILKESAKETKPSWLSKSSINPVCLCLPASHLKTFFSKNKVKAPKLILTSPPYPGVHVLYHRWQIQGRRETPAPYWITGTFDGNGETYYTLGNREQKNLIDYFKNLRSSFSSLAKISDSETTVVQLVAFSDPEWQLPKYLHEMRVCGFQEIKYPSLANAKDQRLWRNVPNRKWHAHSKGRLHSSQEVVLFHRLKCKYQSSSKVSDENA